MSLFLNAHEVRGVLVVDMTGRLTVLEENLRETILQYLQAGIRNFVLRMNDLSYVDSCGLGQLITVYTSIKSIGGNMQLQAPSKRVRELLKITKLDTIFDIIEDESRNAGLKTVVA